jgi:hypothetical protein
MTQRVYVETSVVSYLTARPSKDPIFEAHRLITVRFWEHAKSPFELFVSQLVIDEASRGDTDAAARRLEAIESIPLLDAPEEVDRLANAIMRDGALPPNALEDAIHIAIAAVNGMEILVTWNCRHIANAVLRPRIEDACRNAGYDCPVICTPESVVPEDLKDVE